MLKSFDICSKLRRRMRAMTGRPRKITRVGIAVGSMWGRRGLSGGKVGDDVGSGLGRFGGASGCVRTPLGVGVETVWGAWGSSLLGCRLWGSSVAGPQFDQLVCCPEMGAQGSDLGDSVMFRGPRQARRLGSRPRRSAAPRAPAPEQRSFFEIRAPGALCQANFRLIALRAGHELPR